MAGREVDKHLSELAARTFNRAHTPVDGRANEPYQKKQVLDRLAELWEQHPTMRLGQLIGNVYHSTDHGGVRQYYDEDFNLIQALEDHYDRKADGQGTVGTAP